MNAVETAFRARLEPEYSVEQLDQRADSAARICREAVANGDQVRSELALTRLLSRWQRRDGMQAADSWRWRRRHEQVDAIVTALPEDWLLLRDAWLQWYRTLRRVDGAGEIEAGGFAVEKVANQELLGAAE